MVRFAWGPFDKLVIFVRNEWASSMQMIGLVLPVVKWLNRPLLDASSITKVFVYFGLDMFHDGIDTSQIARRRFPRTWRGDHNNEKIPPFFIRREDLLWALSNQRASWGQYTQQNHLPSCSMATREYIKPVFHCCWHNLFEWQGYIRQFSFQIVSSARLATLALAIHDCRRKWSTGGQESAGKWLKCLQPLTILLGSDIKRLRA